MSTFYQNKLWGYRVLLKPPLALESPNLGQRREENTVDSVPGSGNKVSAEDRGNSLHEK